MRILVLGGTVFLSQAVAVEALLRGHDVTCASRGRSGQPPEGARHVVWDRDEEPPADLHGPDPYDAVVDVARQPSHVRRAVAAVPDAHWVFVSTVSVYADEATPGGRPGLTLVREAITADVDLAADPEAYGGLKVGCEQAVVDGVASAAVVRPGLIVGPGDPTGRFSYWPRRLAEGGEVLAPGAPEDVMQVIDVRDLAAWIVHLAEQRTTGVFDAVGAPLPMRELLEACAAGVAPGEPVRWTWVDQDRLTDLEVQPWAGPASIPLWLPRPEYDGLGAHDHAPACDAGLVLRPVADTARDTLAWLAADPDAPVTGIDREREAELLRAADPLPRR